MRVEANNFFVEAAEAYFETRLEAEREKILNSVIVGQIKALGSFWKQLAIALVTAILVPLILGGIIALALIYDKGMFTTTSIVDYVHGTSKPSDEKVMPHAPH